MLKINKSAPCLFYPVAKEMGISMQELLTNSAVQKKVLIEIANKYPVDTVIRMTEIWCEAASFGMPVFFPDNDFPKLGSALFNEAHELKNIALPSAYNKITKPLIDAVAITKPKLDKSLIVGVTAPYTLASVLNGSGNFMINCMIEKETAKEFLQRITDYLIEYINEYKKAGANGIILAEPSVAMISPDMTEKFSNCYIREIIENVQDEKFAVIYHNCGDVNAHLSCISSLPAFGFHFGNHVDMEKTFEIFPKHCMILGNIDPQLFLPGSSPKKEIMKIKDSCSKFENFVLSTGCDLHPCATKENITTFFRQEKLL